MPNFLSRFRQHRARHRETMPKLMQYVGDDTILAYGKDEVFVYLDGRDASLTPCLLRDGTWEPALDAFLKRTLRTDDCFVDIGANNGIHALRAARQVGANGVVIAFEPQQRLYELLHRSTCANLLGDRMHLRRMAIGASEGVANLGKFAHFMGSATMTANAQIIAHEAVPIAPLPTALSDIASETGRPIEPTIIKIDVEGFEYDVWLGMREWTHSRKNLIMVIEYSPVSYRDMGYDPLALLLEFETYGFKVSALARNGSARALTHAEMEIMSRSAQQYDLVVSKQT